VYNITGKVTEEFGFYSLEVHQLIKCNMVEDPRYKDEPQLPKIPLPPQPKDAVYAGEL
jgi:hypothetical protein